MHSLRVLVTGGGGDIGRGIAKILRELPYVTGLFGADVNDRFPHELIYDGFAKAPRCDDPGYLSWLAATAGRFDANLIVPMSEPEIRLLNTLRLRDVSTSIPLLLPSNAAMDVGFSKLATARFLEASSLPYPWTVRADQSTPVELPCIMKDDEGSGSKTLFRITEDNLVERVAHPAGMIYQELLRPDDEEYTCGVFRSKTGSLATITLHRWLAGGRTGYAEVVNVPQIDALLERLAAALDLVGSINVQLRLTDRGPVVFEINPRFSSTVTFRHLLGFTDLDWAIRDHFDALDAPAWNEATAVGKRLFRADDEIIY